MKIAVGRLYEDAEGTVGFCTKSSMTEAGVRFLLMFTVPNDATYPMEARIYAEDGTSAPLPALVKELWAPA